MFIVSTLVDYSDKENEISLSEHTLSFIECRTYACKFKEIIGIYMQTTKGEKKKKK